jgi:hypothetical protein
VVAVGSETGEEGMSESKTPRTDENCWPSPHGTEEFCNAIFARQLETELNEAKADSKFMCELLTDWKEPFDNHPAGIRLAVAQLLKDKHDQLTTALKERDEVRETETTIRSLLKIRGDQIDEAKAAFPDTYYADRPIADRIKFMAAGWAKAVECLENQSEWLDKLTADRDNWKQLAEDLKIQLKETTDWLYAVRKDCHNWRQMAEKLNHCDPQHDLLCELVLFTTRPCSCGLDDLRAELQTLKAKGK